MVRWNVGMSWSSGCSRLGVGLEQRLRPLGPRPDEADALLRRLGRRGLAPAGRLSSMTPATSTSATASTSATSAIDLAVPSAAGEHREAFDNIYNRPNRPRIADRAAATGNLRAAAPAAGRATTSSPVQDAMFAEDSGDSRLAARTAGDRAVPADVRQPAAQAGAPRARWRGRRRNRRPAFTAALRQCQSEPRGRGQRSGRCARSGRAESRGVAAARYARRRRVGRLPAATSGDWARLPPPEKHDRIGPRWPAVKSVLEIARRLARPYVTQGFEEGRMRGCGWSAGGSDVSGGGAHPGAGQGAGRPSCPINFTAFAVDLNQGPSTGTVQIRLDRLSTAEERQP